VNAISTRALVDRKLARGDNLPAYVLWLLWQCIRLPMFLLLAILEPVVSLVLGSLGLLGVLTAFFWRFIGPPTPRISRFFWSLAFLSASSSPSSFTTSAYAFSAVNTPRPIGSKSQTLGERTFALPEAIHPSDPKRSKRYLKSSH